MAAAAILPSPPVTEPQSGHRRGRSRVVRRGKLELEAVPRIRLFPPARPAGWRAGTRPAGRDPAGGPRQAGALQASEPEARVRMVVFNIDFQVLVAECAGGQMMTRILADRPGLSRAGQPDCQQAVWCKPE